MTDNVESLLLEHMKRFQASPDRIEHKITELTVRISTLKAVRPLSRSTLRIFLRRTLRNRWPSIE